MILCSAGDFYGGAGVFNEPKSHLVARMMGYLKYDAIAVGEMELNYGLEKLLEDASDYSLNLTCANLIAKDGKKAVKAGNKKARNIQKKLKTVFPPFLVVERNGVKFGFVALLSPQTKIKTTRPDVPGNETGEVEAVTYVITDPLESAREVVPEARGSCDVLVLLAHMDQFDLEALLPNLDGIDLAVLGHNGRNAAVLEPIMMGGVPVYRSTAQGQNIGNLKITVDENKKIVDTNNKIYFLGDEFPDDEKVAAILDQFDEENKKVQKELFAREQLRATRAQGEMGDVYLGVGACMGCHSEAFNTYIATGHATAYKTLSSQFMQRDPACVACHVTGYLKKGGFTGMRKQGAPVDLVDVQCEACHGPGAEHSRDGEYGARAAKSCAACHTKAEDPDFDFAKAWPKIAH